MQNHIFKVTNYRQIILIFSLLEYYGSKCSLFYNCYVVLSHNTLSPKWEIEGIVWRDQTTSAKETTVSMVVMHSILTLKYLDNRDSISHNICVSSDKLGFFSCLSASLLFFLKLCYFGWQRWKHKGHKPFYLNPPSQKITLACYACLFFKRSQ